MKYYAGVGSRQTPEDILKLMYKIAIKLAKKNYILRSGGAVGADKAFENGAISISSKIEIYRPNDANLKSIKIAKKFHPHLEYLGEYVQNLHGRNVFQVIGKNLKRKEKSQFIICWTPDGIIKHSKRSKKTGGTGTAISVANHYDVKVWNLKRRRHYNIWKKYVINKNTQIPVK